MSARHPQHELLPRFVELETSTRCNRSCTWCPNHVYERGRTQRLMAPELFRRIVDDLSTLPYEGQLALHNYNEPLLDPRLFERLALARASLPHACLSLFTNGDVLTPRLVERLGNAGVQVLHVSLHDATDAPDPQRVVDRARRRLGLSGPSTEEADAFGQRVVSSVGAMRVVLSRVPRSALTSRGGVLPELDRPATSAASCALPFTSAAIDVDGTMKLCCEVYPDHPPHAAHGLIGSLADATFADLWFSETYSATRRRILAALPGSAVCAGCPGYPIAPDPGRLDRWRVALGAPGAQARERV